MSSSAPPWPAAITIRSSTCLTHRMLWPFLGSALVAVLMANVSVIASYTAAALAGIPLLYRACRHGVRFDDRGITVRNFYRTHKLSWHDVSHFTDSRIGTYVEGKVTYFWAVGIMLNSGRSVTAEGTMRERKSNVPKVLATMDQVTARWQIPGQLTGRYPVEPQADHHLGEPEEIRILRSEELDGSES